MHRKAPTSRPARRSAGFTLLEALIALTVLSVVMGAMLFTLTRMETISEQQLTIAEVQQSARAAHEEAVRMVRMAGRGGLQQDAGRLGRAVVVRNNVGSGPESREVAVGTSEPKAMEGTDILIVRGVLTTDLFVVDYQDPAHFTFDDSTGKGFVTVPLRAATGLAQDLEPLIEANNRGVEEALVLIDADDASTYGVARLVPGAPAAADAPEIRLEFDIAGGHGPEYAQLSRDHGGRPQFPELNGIAFVGVMEEYRYYVRDDEDLGPTLSRARMFPHTETPWDNDPDQLQVDYAVGVVDQQVALAFDSAVDGATGDDDDAAGPDDQIVERGRTEASADDWIFNQPTDDATDSLWIGPWQPDDPAATYPKPRLYAVRVSTLAMAQKIERGHPSDLLEGLEDREYTNDPDDPVNGDPNRLKRKRLLQTVVKPRNL